MSKTSAKVISDSVSPNEIRLTTIQITFPRFLLPEFNTHRVFSRNFRSSRAVPVAKLIEEVRESPYEPAQWLKNQPGMQATEPMGALEAAEARITWRNGAKLAAETAERLLKAGTHKQWANRVLEPYLYVHGVVTATEWSNFFELRDHKDAQPEIQALAKAIRQKKISVARCARTSYLTHEGTKPTVTKDLKLYDDLVGARPLHASPAEHQATPDKEIRDVTTATTSWEALELHGNFQGWVQHRKIIEETVFKVAA